MLLRLFCSLLVVLFISSCEAPVEEKSVSHPRLDIRLSEEEVDSLKSFIIREYWKYDSIYFSPSDNCYIRQFVENELQDFGYFYDTVFRGMSIKHYFFPYSYFRFNLIRGSNGKFYYLGLSDWQYVFQGILNEQYIETSRFEYRLKDDNLTNLKLNASTEGAFNRIFKEDTLFHFSGYSDSFQALSNAEGFVYSNYKYVQEGGGYPFVHILGRQISLLKIRFLMEELKGSTLSDTELELSKRIEKRTYNSMIERTNLYHINKVGMLSFHFKKEITLGRITLEESLVPAMERPYISLLLGIDQLIDWSLYQDCRDLPNTIVSTSAGEN